jgi:hypothetical protein
LNEARELMTQEKYTEAMVTLDNLKDLDKTSEHDYNYDLVHQLYQLDSNCKSAYHQQIILEIINDIPNTKSSLSLDDLNSLLKDKEKLNISLLFSYEKTRETHHLKREYLLYIHQIHPKQLR